MCGIAGCISFATEGAHIGPMVRAMTRALAHRGPDDEGLLYWRRGCAPAPAATDQTVSGLRETLGAACDAEPWQVALGHRRFSIVDVSANGHQPFMDPGGRAALVFNGEIYNHIELRRELEILGHRFRTRCDTEVLLEAYLEWGEGMLPRLNGMWAFAVLDFRTGRVLLSRDRIGEKTLFHTQIGDRFYFASELKSLFVVPEIWNARKPHEARVRDFLYLGLRDHTHETFFEGIVNLPPASSMWVDARGATSPATFWSLPNKRWTMREVPYGEARHRLETLLGESIALRLRADVPLAAELSGGMDSTTMVAMAARHLREQKAPHRLRTFTIRYDDPQFDESPYAAMTAGHVDAEFNAIRLTSEDYWSHADGMMRVLEQPYQSPNLLGCQAMWKQMKALGIRVSLNGGAGDELLAGYTFQHLIPFLADLVCRGRWLAALREGRAWADTDYLNNVEVRRYLIHQLPHVFNSWYMRRIPRLPLFRCFTAVDSELNRMAEHYSNHARGGLDRRLHRDMEFFPIPMYVVQSDKLAMSIPIEIRYPFLDHRLIDAAFQLPTDYFIRGGRSKAILRDAARGLVPDPVINRRLKMGFPVPLGQWMREGREHIRREFGPEQRSGRFVNGGRLCDESDRLDAEILWRAHQIELWMRTFDLH